MLRNVTSPQLLAGKSGPRLLPLANGVVRPFAAAPRLESVRYQPVKPGFYLLRLRLQYRQNGARRLARIL